MTPANDLLKELEELASPLADMPKANPYALPPGYFETFGQSLADSLKYEDEPALSLPKTLPYSLPAGYFESFSSNVMEVIAEDPSFGKIDAAEFQVPEGYFQKFPQEMLALAKGNDGLTNIPVAEKKGNIISFFPQKAIRWAAAAGLILALGFGGYKMMAPESKPLSTELQLAQLDKKVITGYVQQHLDEFDTEMLAEANPVLNKSAQENIDNLKDSDISKYLDEEGI